MRRGCGCRSSITTIANTVGLIWTNPYKGYLPFSPELQDVRNVPELAARGVTQEMYARIFVYALAHVPGFQLKDDDRYCMTLDLEGLRQCCCYCCTCKFCPPCLCQAYMNETACKQCMKGNFALGRERHRAAAHRHPRRRREDSELSSVIKSTMNTLSRARRGCPILHAENRRTGRHYRPDPGGRFAAARRASPHRRN